MSLEQECKEVIYNYVDEETQMNAALTGEHKEYVTLCISLLRLHYAQLLSEGATTFTVSDDIAVLLTQECPW